MNSNQAQGPRMTIGLQSLINAAYAYAPAGWPANKLAPIIAEMQIRGEPERDIALSIMYYLFDGLNNGVWE